MTTIAEEFLRDLESDDEDELSEEETGVDGTSKDSKQDTDLLADALDEQATGDSRSSEQHTHTHHQVAVPDTELLGEDYRPDDKLVSDSRPGESDVAGDGDGDGDVRMGGTHNESVEDLGQELVAETVHDVARLVRKETFQELLKRVRSNAKDGADTKETYNLIVDCNKVANEIDNEIGTVHIFIRDSYAPHFPELDSMVMNALDYARVVKRIGNETDVTLVKLDDLLPSATMMIVTVAATTTDGRLLTEEELKRVDEACDMAIELDSHRQEILSFVESHMRSVAPNLTAVLGASVAAQLMGLAGGLYQLSKLPAGNIQVLGKAKKGLQGFSTKAEMRHVGVLGNCDLLKQIPPALRVRAIRFLSTKCVLAARCDSFHQSPGGDVGEKLKTQIVQRLEKLQEPPPAPEAKALPAPDEARKKRRGGRKARKLKATYEETEMRKQANRIQFGVQEKEIGLSGEGLGMLGQKDHGKLRMQKVVKKGSHKHKSKKLMKLEKLSQQQHRSIYASSGASSGATNGISSSLVFTPVQGLELVNPDAHKKVQEANEKYFAAGAKFSKVGPAAKRRRAED